MIGKSENGFSPWGHQEERRTIFVTDLGGWDACLWYSVNGKLFRFGPIYLDVDAVGIVSITIPGSSPWFLSCLYYQHEELTTMLILRKNTPSSYFT